MSRTIPAALQTHLNQEVVTLATCWRITRVDGQIFRYTDHDQDVVVGAETFVSASGYTSSSVETREAFAVGNLEISGLLNTSLETDLIAGKYYNAEVEIFLVNHQNTSDGSVTLRKGWIGEINTKDGVFVAELRGLASKLTQQIGSVYSPSCRVDLGSAECGVNLASFTETGTVTQVTDNKSFRISSTGFGDQHFTWGQLTWTSGNNNGLKKEVWNYLSTNGDVVLFEEMPFAVQVGDAYSVYAGCNKFIDTCRVKFNNVINFRGEPFTPGIDTAVRYVVRS